MSQGKENILLEVKLPGVLGAYVTDDLPGTIAGGLLVKGYFG